MQIGRVINLKGYNKFFAVIKCNYVLIIFSLVFLITFAFSLFSFDSLSFFESFSNEYLKDYMSLRVNNGFLKITLDSFFLSFTYIILIFISGSSVLGMVILPFIVATKGLVYGSIMCELYTEYALKGIAFNAVMVLPVAAVAVTAIILASVEALDFSLKVSKLTLSRTMPTNLHYDFKKYCGKFLTFLIITLFSALIDGVISCYLSKSFML